MTRRQWWTAAAVGVLGAGFVWKLAGGKEPTGELRFETAKADRGRISARVTATGTLQARVTVQVGSQVSGRIQELYVDFNSPVKKGDVIARIDPRLFEAAVEQARANLTAAQSNSTKAKVRALEAERNQRRTVVLTEKKLLAQAEADTAQAAVDTAKAEVAAAQGEIARAQAALNQATINLNYTTILSPIDGVVISRDVELGQTVAASLQAPTLFTLAEDLGKMRLDTSVAEADVGKLTPGMKASFTVDAYSGERFVGTVQQIRNAPKTVQNVVTYNAVVGVENAESKLRPGMTANVTFVYAERDDVVRIPNAALRFRAPKELSTKVGLAQGSADAPPRRGGAGALGREERAAMRTQGAGADTDFRRVWVLRAGSPTVASVKLGVSDGTFTEVVEGELREGDELIVESTGGSSGGGGGGSPPAFRRML